MARKVCAEPGCPTLTDTTRCTEHTRARDKARGSRQARGYDAAHDKLRTQWQARIDRGDDVRCWRPGCGVRLTGRAWHLGHDDHDRSVYRGPECIACNLSAAGRSRRS